MRSTRTCSTPFGPRTLDPADLAYHGRYGGDAAQRDGGYHEGPVWPWLMGAYVDATMRYRSAADPALLLEPFAHHLGDAGLGSISELLDGDAPHEPGGAIAQAWSVAELLRVWRLLQR
jgi:glycogen debranching enzyme